MKHTRSGIIVESQTSHKSTVQTYTALVFEGMRFFSVPYAKLVD